MCGGLAQSDLFVQTNADVLGLCIVRPVQIESVLKGAAMLGARADNKRTMRQVIQDMEQEGHIFTPNLDVASYHEKKYKVFLAMCQDQMKYRSIMKC